ncbi:MAG: exodeoxyribonuclease VII large subunit [Burkholderiales bacterium]|nr:exodeoxyribonuclease VII large subunit [Burkholderiales bacterium]
MTASASDIPPLTPSVASVSELLQRILTTLERDIPLSWVRGEISGFKRAASGHCYFDLKDERGQLACVLFRNRMALVPFALADGMAVECFVRVTVYEPRGQLQAVVEQVRAAGLGPLYEAYLRLKARLEAEGLFDPARKRPLPVFPRTIGLITSREAAAFADLVRVLRDRWPRARVILYPAAVQGAHAPGELIAALARANARRECDVLIIGRGGGSLEDLWAFNDEALVRAVAASVLPIVSAVGHETDVTLCDFAADRRAPTPSAAAALVVPDQREVAARVATLAGRLQRAQNRRLETLSQRLDRAAARLGSASRLLLPSRERLGALRGRLRVALERWLSYERGRLGVLDARLSALVRRTSRAHPAREQLERITSRLAASVAARLRGERERLDRLSQAIALLNPSRVLERGYALAFAPDGSLITDASRLTPGERVRVEVARGAFEAEVRASRP